MREFEVLDEFLDKCKNIYIYGCGKYGRIVGTYIRKTYRNINYKFVVSKKSSVNMNFLGVDVHEIDDVTVEQEDGIIVAMQNIPFSVKEKCFGHFKENIFFLYSDIIKEFDKWMRSYLCNAYEHLKLDYRLSISVKKQDPSCIYVVNKDNKPFFRIYDLDDDGFDKVSILCTEKKFENEYGQMKFLNDITIFSNVEKKADVSIYIMTSHLDNMDPIKEQLKPFEKILQVGSVLTNKKKKCLQDCIGENISQRNREYCECTGLYWMWKNDTISDYVGLEHYRRRMYIPVDINDIMLTNDVDIILPIPQFCVNGIYALMVKSLVTDADWKKVKELIISFDRNYELIIDKYENSFFYFSCNIGLMNKKILDDYCKFAFYIAEELESYYMEHNIIRKADRYMGFIFEHLFSIYLMKNYKKYTVYLTELLWCE